jgi:hypothetical protein
MLLPMALNTGMAFWTSIASPPTMMLRVPFWAPSEPPETGASSMGMPFLPSSAAIRRVADGLMVDMSTTIAPARAP